MAKVNASGQESGGKSAGEALGLKRERGYYYDLHDQRTGLSFLRSGEELCSGGLQLMLSGYEYHLFLGFEELYDVSGEYAVLAEHLGGSGTQSIGDALRSFRLLPLHQAFAFFLDAEAADGITSFFFDPDPTKAALRKSAEETGKRFIGLLAKIQSFIGKPADIAAAAASLSANLQNARRILQQSGKEKFPLDLPANVDRRKFSCTLFALVGAMRMGEFVKRFEHGGSISEHGCSAGYRAKQEIRCEEGLSHSALSLRDKYEPVMRVAARTLSGFVGV